MSDMYCEFVEQLKKKDRLCLGAEQSGSLLVAGADQMGVVAEQLRRHGGLSASFGHIALTLFRFHEDSTTTGAFEDACVHYHGTKTTLRQSFLDSMTLYGLLRSEHTGWSLTDFLFKTPKRIWPWVCEIGDDSSILLVNNQPYGIMVKCTINKSVWASFLKTYSGSIASFVSRQGPAKISVSWRSLTEVRAIDTKDKALLNAFQNLIVSEVKTIRQGISSQIEDNYGPADKFLIPLVVALSKTLLTGVCNGSGAWEHCKYFVFSALSVFKYEQLEKSCAGFFLTSNGSESPEQTIENMMSMTHFISSYWTYYSYRTAAVARALRHATRAASAAILSRNMSHHIGSHVMPRATVKDVKARLNTLYERGEKSADWLDESPRISRSVERLKTTLDDFIQKKADFLAEVTTDPNSSSDSKRLGRDILAPLMRNALLTDNIARNEGFGYPPRPLPREAARNDWWKNADANAKLGWERMLSANEKAKIASIRADNTIADGKKDTMAPLADLQMRMRSTLKLSLCVREDGQCRRILGPDLPPYDPLYGLEGTKHEPEQFGVDANRARLDPMIAVPGMVGQYAIYGILENIIRNAAKHGKKEDKSGGLHIHMHIEEDGEDYYRLSIWDDRADPANVTITAPIPNQPEVKPKKRRLAEHLQCWAEADLIDPSGAVRRDAWGVAEIVICANLLAGRRQFDYQRDIVEIVEGSSPHESCNALTCEGRGVSHEGCQKERLIHRIRLLKAKRAVFVGQAFTKTWGEHLKSLKREGVYVFASIDELKVLFKKTEGCQAFQFAVFEGEGFDTLGDGSEKWKKAREVFLAALPFRVFWLKPGNTPSADPPIRRAICLETNPFVDPAGAAPTADALMELLWQHWIRDNKELNPANKSVTNAIYLDVNKDQSPHADWARVIPNFNKPNGPVHMYLESRGEGNEQERLGTEYLHDSIQAGFFRHRTTGGIAAGDMFEVFGKRSADCDMLLGATLPTEDRLFWELPYAMAEAGLVRILVLDERMAERAMTAIPVDCDIKKELVPDGFEPCFWHLARRAKIYIATHLQVGDDSDSKPPLHDSFKDAESKFQTAESNTHPTCPFLKIRISSAGLKVTGYSRCGPAKPRINENPPEEPHPEFDIVVIHQGIIDTYKPKMENGDGEETMRKWIIETHPWLVVESGRGIPPGLQKKPIRFLSFSVLDQAMTADGIGKLLLTRRLMALPRFVGNGGEL